MSDKPKAAPLNDEDLDGVTGGDKLGNFDIQDLMGKGKTRPTEDKLGNFEIQDLMNRKS